MRKKSSPVSVRKLSAMFSGKSEAEVTEAMREMAPRQSAGEVDAHQLWQNLVQLLIGSAALIVGSSCLFAGVCF